MKLSIVIPTHNRSSSLRRVLDTVVTPSNEIDVEIVVVDNNSTDDTKGVVESFANKVRYIFEPNTSFTRARGAGADKAAGDVLLYLDDDVVVQRGSLAAIMRVFESYTDCGVVAGRILPKFECAPPDWAVACQRTFNGWSLYSPAVMPALGSGFQQVENAYGPMMAIRRTAYDTVGGFPPDTVGVETNVGKRAFRKLYVGPGDYGLCTKVRRAGYKIYYSPDVSCHHCIPEIRFTVAFWRSRMIGEGHHLAVTNREFHGMTASQLAEQRYSVAEEYRTWAARLVARLEANERFLRESGFDGMLYEELWLHYGRAYLDMARLLSENEGLSKLLWEIGTNGVSTADFERVSRSLPSDFWNLIADERMYAANPIVSVADLHAFFPDPVDDRPQRVFGKLPESMRRPLRLLLPPALANLARRYGRKVT